MSFMNKVKNFFYEDIEEDDDDELLRKEALKREEKLRKKEEKKKLQIEKEERIDTPSNPNLSERELFKSEKTFNFPMDIGDNIFDDDDTEIIKEESRSSIKEEKNIYARSINRPAPTPAERISSYKQSTESNNEPKKFHPSPVVSPVYGVLDKNYTVEDVVDRNLSKTKEFSIEKKTVDFDSVRNRAYKELDEEIEKTLNGTKDIFYNLDEEIREESNETIDDYQEEPYDKDETDDVVITYEQNDDYQEPIEEEKEDLDDINFETPDVKIPKEDEEVNKEEDDSYDETPAEKEEKEDLFNLIDNMYSDEEDEEEED